MYSTSTQLLNVQLSVYHTKMWYGVWFEVTDWESCCILRAGMSVSRDGFDYLFVCVRAQLTIRR